MKIFTAQSIILGTILLGVLSCIGVYFLWGTPVRSAVNSIVEVRRCEAQMRKKLNIRWTNLAISDYAVSLLHPGMTRAEVSEALENIAPVQVKPYDSGMDEVHITPCGNRFKNVLLYVYYSSDGGFTRVQNAFDDR